MSSWLCSDRHFLYLATLEVRMADYTGRFKEYVSPTPKELRDRCVAGTEERFLMLRDANLLSLNTRYPSYSQGEQMPPDLSRASEVPFTATEIPSALKAISCYGYQACEADSWEGSPAQRYCRLLEERAIAAMPGYEFANWGEPNGPEGGRLLELEASDEASAEMAPAV